MKFIKVLKSSEGYKPKDLIRINNYPHICYLINIDKENNKAIIYDYMIGENREIKYSDISSKV